MTRLSLPKTGDMVSVVKDEDGRRYQGWLAFELENGRAVIELIPKYGAMREDIPPVILSAALKISLYRPHRKGSHFIIGGDLRKIRKWNPRSLDPEIGYKVLKSRQKGSVRVGDVWITMIEETPEEC